MNVCDLSDDDMAEIALLAGCAPEDDDAIDEGTLLSCPMCGEENAPIGALGRRSQYNCRDCDWWYGQD